ncbi:endospore germination permease [Alkalihalophilus sp. As8PL]|uniref:Endospore germination permease n=1 Tax=Alkalihalophilus sp. As8PL TaxID=3237103 RepID=A0AB39BV31_9BACI
MKTLATIGGRELFAIIVLAIGTKITSMTPAILAQEGKNAFWMMPVIGFLTIFPSFLLLLYLLRTYKDKHLMELIYHILGKWVGALFGLTIFLVAFVSLVLESRNYIDELSSIFFPQSPQYFLYAVLFFICLWGARKGLNVIGSTSWILTPFIKIIAIILLFLAMKDLVWMRIFPIWGEGMGVTIIEGAKKASIFGDLFLLTMAYTSLTNTKVFRQAAYIGGTFAVFELTMFFLVYSLFFDYKSIDQIAYPFHELTQYISIGMYFANVESFFMIFWLFAAFLRFMIYLYFTTWIFAAVFQIKQFKPLLGIFLYLVIMLGTGINNPIQNVLVYRDWFLTMTTPLFILMPLVLWVVAKVKGELAK